MTTHTVTLIPGDGIGVEVTTATRKIIDATGVKIDWDVCEAGAEVFKKGLDTGVPLETIDSIRRNKVALKGPLETPVGYGAKSANVTLRKMFETYGNIRPIRELPGVPTPYSGRNLDFVIVRENVEDLYAGIEHMQSPNVAQCLKLISRKGCEKIIRLAFEFTRSEGRTKLHCATKANIMKLTEGFMKRTFEEVAKEYPDIEAHHIIVDNCAHMLVKNPEMFDVIVTTNMNGDILSDLGSALIGGLGFAPGANIGDDISIFEAVHGSAPKYAGQNNINPTAVLLSGVMMLRHLGEFNAAQAIEGALCHTLATDRFITRDIKVEGVDPVSTTDFTDKIIENLNKDHGDVGRVFNREYKPIQKSPLPTIPQPKKRRVAGVDVFIEAHRDIENTGVMLQTDADACGLMLKLLSCRGVQVFPREGDISPDITDVVRCRFMEPTDGDLKNEKIHNLLHAIESHTPWTHIEKLHEFDGVPAYSKAHGER